mgnify:CR=1 FL=1
MGFVRGGRREEPLTDVHCRYSEARALAGVADFPAHSNYLHQSHAVAAF